MIPRHPTVFVHARGLKAAAPTRHVAHGEKEKKKGRRKSKAAAVLPAPAVLWYVHAYVHPGLALLVTIMLVPTLASFFVLRRRSRSRSRAKRVLFEMEVRDLDQMDGISFEKFLESLFALLGYESEATRAGGDYPPPPEEHAM